METKRICPSCQKTLPANVPLGLCPECLIKSGFNTGTEPGNPGKASGFVPPPVEQIRKLFPQLEIIELVGKGGMGAVYKARQAALDRLVALKILPPGAAGDAGFAERFNREARALARLNHPHIVAVHDFGQVGGQPYLVMEFVDGPNLRQVEQAGRLTPAQALEIIPQICEALQFAHNEGVVHRDIKPENILLDKRGRVKITDFGIAKILGAPSGKSSLTGAKDVLGTPHYMAPEQVEHPQAVDHRADIYSLGVVFYELLTGELPLGKFQPPSRKVQVDVRLDEVVLHTLEKEPERRYQHASEVKTDVETIAATPGQSSTAASPESGALLMTSACYISTPEYLRTFRGRFLNIYQGSGELRLNNEELNFRSGWSTVTIPLSSVRKLAQGDYPYSAKPVPIHYIAVTFVEGGQERTLLFTPVLRAVMLPDAANKFGAEWLVAIQEAFRARTGRTLSVELSDVAQDKFWVIKTLLATAVSITVALWIIPLIVHQRLPNRPSEWLPVPGLIAAVILMAVFLTARWWRNRSALNSGNFDAITSAGVTPSSNENALAKSPMVRIGEALCGITFSSPAAIKLLNISALGSLGFLGFLGTPWSSPFFAFFSLYALFVVAYFLETANARGSSAPAPAENRQGVSGWLRRSLIPEDTAARWARWLSFGAALVILVLGLFELPKFDLRPHELFFGVLLVLILTFVILVAGYLAGAVGRNRLRQELAQRPGAPAASGEEGALAQARQEVKAPASWLVATGILNWVTIPLLVLVVGAIQDDAIRRPLLPLVPLAAFILSGGMIAAGLRMKRLEAHSLAVIGSILAILVAPGNIIGLPIGIWSLIVLCRREVREAFGRGSPLAAKSPPPARSSGSWRAVAVAVVSHAVLLLAVVVFFVTAVPRIYEEFNDFAFALPTGTVLTFGFAQFIRNHVFILVPLALALDVAICWLVQRFGGRRLLGLWAVIVSIGLTALVLGSLWLLNLPLQKLPTTLWERNERVLAVLQSDPVREEVQRRLRAANVEFTSPNIHLQPEHNRAIWYFGELKELKPVGETNVWTPIQGTLTQRVLPDGSWEVQGEGDLKHIRFSVGATSSPPAGNGLTFGPVTMAALSDANPATDRSFIDLDNGKTFTPPPRVSLSAPWLAQNGIDAVVATQAGLQGLVALNMSVVQASPEEWDTVAAGAVSKRIRLGRPPAEQMLNSKGALPATYLFKTREGGMGVLQITHVSDNPRDVKIRYKLATGAAERTKLSLEKPDSKPATLGPGIESVLKAQEVRPEGRVAELLDLDTGRRATSTNFGDNDRETHSWVRTNQLDVIGVIEHGQIAVLCFDTVVMPAVSNDWETVTAQNVVTNWNLAQSEPNKITGISPMTDKTDTWLFRTREGGRGLLQILGQNSNPPGVKVRYKLVQAP